MGKRHTAAGRITKAKAKAKVATANGRVAELEAELAAANGRIAELEAKIAKAMPFLRTLKEMVEILNADDKH